MKKSFFAALLIMVLMVAGCVRTKGAVYYRTENGGLVQEEYSGLLPGPATLQPIVFAPRWWDGYRYYDGGGTIVVNFPTYGGCSNYIDSSRRHAAYYSHCRD